MANSTILCHYYFRLPRGQALWLILPQLPLLHPPSAPCWAKYVIFEMAVKGGPILIPIGILSILAIYIFFERLFVILKFSRLDQNFMNQIRDQVHQGNVQAARSLCKATDNPIARMIDKGLARLGKPIREIESAIENQENWRYLLWKKILDSSVPLPV